MPRLADTDRAFRRANPCAAAQGRCRMPAQRRARLPAQETRDGWNSCARHAGPAMVLAEPPGIAIVDRELPAPAEVLVGDVAEGPAEATARRLSEQNDPAIFVAALEQRHCLLHRRNPGYAPGLALVVIEAQRRPHETLGAGAGEFDPQVL